MVQDKRYSCNRRLIETHMAYQMAGMLLTLSELEGHFCCLKPF